jgi:hypothetical protein
MAPKGLQFPCVNRIDIDMDHLLAWQNIIFYIPLAVGLLLVFGSAFSGHVHEASAHHDVEHGVEHGQGGSPKDGGALDGSHGHDHDGAFFAKALSMFGVGRVPLTVVLMLVSLLFGGIGIIANTILSSFGLPASLYGPIAIAAAFVGMLALTRSAIKLLNRFMPTTETYRVSRHDFAGCTGTLLLPADTASGYAQVKDHEGNVHNIKCRTVQGTLPKGEAILVVKYEQDTQTFLVDTDPTSVKSPN